MAFETDPSRSDPSPMAYTPRLPSPHDVAACMRGGCRIDHRGDSRYEEARRSYLLEKARKRRAEGE